MVENISITKIDWLEMKSQAEKRRTKCGLLKESRKSHLDTQREKRWKNRNKNTLSVAKVIQDRYQLKDKCIIISVFHMLASKNVYFMYSMFE